MYLLQLYLVTMETFVFQRSWISPWRCGNKIRATCLATQLQQNKLNSDVSRFTNHIKPVLQQIRFLTSLIVSGKTRNIAFQLVLLPCCKTSFTFFVARFYAPWQCKVTLWGNAEQRTHCFRAYTWYRTDNPQAVCVFVSLVLIRSSINRRVD